MDVDNLIILVEKCKENDNESYIKLFSIFNPIVSKYCRKLNHDDAQSEFYYTIYNSIQTMDLSKFSGPNSTACLVSYISKAIYHKYIELSQLYAKLFQNQIAMDTDNISELASQLIDLDLRLMMISYVNVLPSTQRRTIIFKYYYGYSDIEIGRLLHMSRQAVNKSERKALNFLKGLMEK